MIDVTDRLKREQALEEASRKDEFLAMLAHELRNPLAPIASAADLLQRPNLDPAMAERASAIIGRQVRHLTSLVNDLLDVSRVTLGQVALDRTVVDLRQTVIESVEQVRPLIEARRHKLTTNTSPKPALVSGDAKRFVQVVTNLLTNAAKYTPEGGQITIDLDVQGAEVHLSVSDTGLGMAPELLKRCFDLFFQSERTSERGAGGLGIGLALVRRLVELHNGRVRAESPGDEKGSRFTVSLPQATPLSNGNLPFEDGLAAPLEPAGHGLSVLIVDDNSDAAEMLAMLVGSLGHIARAEGDSRRALDRVRDERPDVCIIDIGMPELDGYQLAQLLRAQAGTTRLTLIAVTGYGQPEDRERAYAAGFDEHLTKPADMNRLAELLSRNRR
jgi:CheY-like chemotaxis protein